MLELTLAICSIMTAIVGGAKNRNWAAWFFIGLLTGPIGFILVAVMPALPKH